jgi:hypothetical protein
VPTANIAKVFENKRGMRGKLGDPRRENMGRRAGLRYFTADRKIVHARYSHPAMKRRPPTGVMMPRL